MNDNREIASKLTEDECKKVLVFFISKAYAYKHIKIDLGISRAHMPQVYVNGCAFFIWKTSKSHLSHIRKWTSWKDLLLECIEYVDMNARNSVGVAIGPFLVFFTHNSCLEEALIQTDLHSS